MIRSLFWLSKTSQSSQIIYQAYLYYYHTWIFFFIRCQWSLFTPKVSSCFIRHSQYFKMLRTQANCLKKSQSLLPAESSQMSLMLGFPLKLADKNAWLDFFKPWSSSHVAFKSLTLDLYWRGGRIKKKKGWEMACLIYIPSSQRHGAVAIKTWL